MQRAHRVVGSCIVFLCIILSVVLLLKKRQEISHNIPASTTIGPVQNIPKPIDIDEITGLYAIMQLLVERDIYVKSITTRQEVHNRLSKLENQNYLHRCRDWTRLLSAPVFVDGWANATAEQKYHYLRFEDVSLWERYLLSSALSVMELRGIITQDIDGTLASQFQHHVPRDLLNSLLSIDKATLDMNPHWAQLLLRTAVREGMDTNRTPSSQVELFANTRLIGAMEGYQAAIEYLNGLTNKVSPTILAWIYGAIIEEACASKSPGEIVDFVKGANLPNEALSNTIAVATELVGKSNEKELIQLVSMITDKEVFDTVSKRWFDSTTKDGAYQQWYNTQQ